MSNDISELTQLVQSSMHQLGQTWGARGVGWGGTMLTKSMKTRQRSLTLDPSHTHTTHTPCDIQAALEMGRLTSFATMGNTN